jgi:hypothetical protein
VFAHACQLGAEGMVSKRVDGTYRAPARVPSGSRFANPASIAGQRERREIWNRRARQRPPESSVDIEVLCRMSDKPDPPSRIYFNVPAVGIPKPHNDLTRLAVTGGALPHRVGGLNAFLYPHIQAAQQQAQQEAASGILQVPATSWEAWIAETDFHTSWQRP